MSTAELVRYIDERTPEERAWMLEYIAWLQRPRKARPATPEEIALLTPAIEDLEARRNCVLLSGEELLTRLAEPPRGKSRKVRA